MVYVKLLPLVCLFTTCLAIDDDFSPRLPQNYNQRNTKTPAKVSDVEANGNTVRSSNHQSYRYFQYPKPGCPNSDTLQAFMKVLLHLLKQKEKQNGAPNKDQISQAVALYKKYLLSSKLTKENVALLNKLVEIEKNLNKNSKTKEEARIKVTFELPVPSHPLCLNALENIVTAAHNAYADLKRNSVCRRSNNEDESPTSSPNADDREPTLQDLLNGIDNSPPSGDEFDIFNILNNYRPKNSNAQNKPFINNDLLSHLLEDPKSKDSASGIPEDLLSQLLPNKKNHYVDDGYKEILLDLLNSKNKNSKQTLTETQNDLLSLLLNKDDENKNPFYDPQTLQDKKPFGKNSYLTSILQDNLAKGDNGILGPSDGFINSQHVPGFGKADPTQDLLSQLLLSQGSNFNSEQKTNYPNPLQDPPLSIEPIDTPKYGPRPKLKEPFLNPNLQDLNGIEFDSKYPNTPYDANALSRILGKLKYATYLANNLSNLKKKPNKPSYLEQNNGPLNNDDDVLSLLQDNNLHRGPYDKNMIPSFYSDKFGLLNSPNGNKFGQGLPEADDPMLGDVPGGKNVFKLMTSPNQTGVLELTYLLNGPVPTVEPFYFVKYKIPYETFALNFQKLLREQSFRPRSPEMFYKELLIKSSSDVVDSSSGLRSSLSSNIIDQLLKNGTLLDAKVVDDNSTHGFVEVTVKALPSDDDVVRFINVLDQEKDLDKENSKFNLSREKVARTRYFNDYIQSRDNVLRKNHVDEYIQRSDKDVSTASLAAMDELRNKVKAIWSPNFLQTRRSDSKEETLTPRYRKSEEKRNADKSDEKTQENQ